MPAWNTGGFGDGGYGDDGTVVPSSPVNPPDYAPPIVDHLALGLSRVITQYQRSPKLLAFLALLLGYSNLQEALLQSLLQLPNYNLMTGVNLDTIAAIVGTTRYVLEPVSIPFFGFQGQADQVGFGEYGLPEFGGRFYEDGEPDTETNVLSDPEFRVVIQAQILVNASKGTPEDVLSALRFLFGTPVVNVDDNGSMAITVAVGRGLTATEQALLTTLKLLPVPAGVRLSGIVSYNVSGYFGFSDQAAALPFGEYGQPSNGALFAEEIT